MPTPDYALTMARYNRWQNRNLLAAAERIGPEGRARDRGAFFGSVEKTFHHLLWADRMWLSRFTGQPPPQAGLAQSVIFDGDWADFRTAREDVDARLLAWAGGLDAAWFERPMTWFSGALGRDMTAPRGAVVLHVFNHQTHHRGQIHAMLTAAGERPGATDLIVMPADA